MSTREQRRAWQDFRERHGVSLAQFRKKWLAMFGRQPKQIEIDEYNEMRDRLRAPLGRKKKPIKAIVDVDRDYPPPGTPENFRCVPLFIQSEESMPEFPVRYATVTKRYEWDMGHRLPEHDGKCRRLHGHRYVAEIDITGPLVTDGPQTGMVIDFYRIKDLIDKTIGAWDHRTMLYSEDPLWLQLETAFEGVPPEDWGAFAVPFIPTAENICHAIVEGFKGAFEAPVLEIPKITRVRVYETPNGWAEVRP